MRQIVVYVFAISNTCSSYALFALLNHILPRNFPKCTYGNFINILCEYRYLDDFN